MTLLELQDVLGKAILTAKLLEYFPDLRHNENQYYGNRSDRK